MTGAGEKKERMDEPDVNGAEVPRQGKGRSDWVTLILIPLVIVIIWLLENYLLAGNSHLFRQASLPGLVIYTVLSRYRRGYSRSCRAYTGGLPFGRCQHVPDRLPVSAPHGSCCQPDCPCRLSPVLSS